MANRFDDNNVMTVNCITMMDEMQNCMEWIPIWDS